MASKTGPAAAVHVRKAASVVALLLAIAPAGCALAPNGGHWWMSSQECMARVMYFESLRSSDDGMLAVGTVVMNRLHSGKYPNTVCGVVGQPNQFAPGALDLPMTGPGRARAERMAAAVLAGARHPGVGNAMFFHTAERQYYRNDVRYVAYAGGNAFYEKGPIGYPYAVAQTFRPQPPRALAFSYPAQGFRPPPQRQPQELADADRLTLFLETGRGLY